MKHLVLIYGFILIIGIVHLFIYINSDKYYVKWRNKNQGALYIATLIVFQIMWPIYYLSRIINLIKEVKKDESY